MTLITPLSGTADPTTTGSELHDFQLNLGDTRVNMDDLNDRLGTVEDAVGATKTALEQVDELASGADTFLSNIKSMRFTLKVTEKVGPLNFVSDFLDGVLEKLETLATHVTFRAKQLVQKIEDGDYVNKLDTAETRIGDLRDGLDLTALKLAEYEQGVFNTRFALGVVGAPADGIEASLNSASAPVNDVLVPLNQTYATVTGKIDDLTGIFNSPSAPSLSVFNPLETLAGQFGAINGSLDFLAGPLQSVYNAVKPVEWALDAVKAVYDVTVGPVIDWVLDSLGITDIMSRIGNAIQSAMPIDLDGVLDEVTAQVDAVFDEIEGFIGDGLPGWDTDIDGIVNDIANDVVGVFDTASTTALRFGSSDNDLPLDGRADGVDILIGLGGQDSIAGAPGGTAADEFDIFIASGGDDTLHGGASTGDFLILPGLLDDWVVTRFSDTAPFVFYHKTGDWGYEVAHDIEYFAFYDGTYTGAALEALGIVTDGQTTGNDLIVGGTGDDRITPLDGSDTVDGGAGHDTYVIHVDQPRGSNTATLKLDAARTAPGGITYEGWSFSSNDVDYLNSIESAIIQLDVQSEMIGTDGNNLLISSNQNDYLFGKDGDDFLSGNGGNDYLRGGSGSDTLRAGDGNDSLLARESLAGHAAVYDGGAGRDRLLYTAQQSNYDIYPPRGNITSSDLISAGPLRIDVLTGTVEHMAADGVTVIATDTVTGVEEIVGSDNDDLIHGAPSVNEHDAIIDGGGGNDTLYSGGADSVRGGTGADTIYATGSGTSVDGGTSGGDNDILDLRLIENARWKANNNSGATFSLFAYEEFEVETLTDETGADTGANARQIFAGSMTKIEELYFGDGNDDFYHNGVGDVTVFGGAGDDLLTARNGNDSVLDLGFWAGVGNDTIDWRDAQGFGYGGAGDDEFTISAAGSNLDFDGGAGDDFFLMRRFDGNRLDGVSEVRGGDGYDRLSLQQRDGFSGMASVFYNAQTGQVSSVMTTGATNYSGLITGFEEVIGATNARSTFIGSDQGDRFIGLGRRDRLEGRDGSDELFGNGDNDTLLGGQGNDLLHGGTGNDSLDGNNGTDTASYSNARPDGMRGEMTTGNFGSVYVNLGTGSSSGIHGNDTLTRIENVIGSMGDDIIIGDALGNVLMGGQGDDLLSGQEGADTIIPGQGDDTLLGGAGEDRFLIGEGASTIHGGSARDVLDLSAAQGDLVIQLAERMVLDVPITVTIPVWQSEAGTDTSARIFAGQSITPQDVLEMSVENANDASDLTRTLPTAADYDADPALPSFEIRFEEVTQTHAITASSVEGVAGGNGKDALTGTIRAERIEGGRGDDTIEGGGGSDGPDDLYGGEGNDLIYGDLASGPVTLPGGESWNLANLNDTALDGRLQSGPLSEMPTTALTVEMLVQSHNATRGHSWFSYGVAGSTNELTLFTAGPEDARVLQVIVNGVGIETDIPVSTFFDGDAHRLAVRVDSVAGTVGVFLDGVNVWEEAHAAATAIDSGGILVLGQDQDGSTPGGGFQSGQAYQGRIGDVRIWDGALSDAELMALAGQDSLANPASHANLAYYWAADPVAGTFGSALSGDLVQHGDVSIEEFSPTTFSGGIFAEGNEGNDTIHGTALWDTLLGNEDDDLLIGGGSGDNILGGTGDDTLDGGDGGDYLQGGAGADIFVLRGGGAYDLILDFEHGTDRLDLTGMGLTQGQIDRAALLAGNDSFGHAEVDFGNGTQVNFIDVGAVDMPGILAGSVPDGLMPDQRVDPLSWTRLSDVLNYDTATMPPIVRFELWDQTGGMNWWTDGGYVDATNGHVATDLHRTWFQGDTVSGRQSMWVRIDDGSGFGAWDRFILSTNSAPEVEIANQKKKANEWTRLADVISVTDPDGDPVTRVEVYDSVGTNSWWADGVYVDASSGHAFKDLTNVWFRADATPGTQRLWVRTFDGDGAGEWEAFNLTTNAAPVATVENLKVASDAITRLSDVMSVSDADGDAITTITLWDSAGPSNWWVNGVQVNAAAGYVANASDDIRLHADAVAGSQKLWVRAADGTDIGAWESFQFTTNAAPVVQAEDQRLSGRTPTPLSEVLSVLSPDGDPVTRIDLWDADGEDSWYVNGLSVDASTGAGYAALPTDRIELRAETLPGTQQTVWARARDAVETGEWTTFEVTTNAAPSVAVDSLSVAPLAWTRLANVMTFADPENDAPSAIELWDSVGGDNWWADGAIVDASTGHVTTDLANVWFRGDATAGVQRLWVRADDGLDWSGWDAFDLTTL